MQISLKKTFYSRMNQRSLYMPLQIHTQPVIRLRKIRRHLTVADKYLHLLKSNVIPTVHSFDAPFEDTWFQQDGFYGHNSLLVKEYLRTSFGDRIIGGDCIVSWPRGLPDLWPTVFFCNIYNAPDYRRQM